jgi:hypothetical protein
MTNDKNKEFEQEIGIYTVYDIKQEIFEMPFFATSDLNAKRRFMIMIDEKDSVLNKWRQDYDLMKLGMYNTKTGIVVQNQKTVMEGKSYVSE